MTPISDDMVERASEQYWNDFHARRAVSSWSSRDPQEVIVIQIKATMRAALTAALEGSVGEPAWQTIETAPKDGTHITLYETDRGAFEGWWHDAWPRACEEYWMDHADSDPEPTHWRPLITPPTT
jgi:hypothetical protein